MLNFLTGLGAVMQALILKVITIAVLVAVAIATVNWSQDNPQQFNSVVDSVGDAAASLIIRACDWVVEKTDGNPRT